MSQDIETSTTNENSTTNTMQKLVLEGLRMDNVEKMVNDAINKNAEQNAKPQWVKYDIMFYAHQKDENEEVMISKTSHSGLIKISKINSLFIGSENDTLVRVYINLEDDIRFSYGFKTIEDAQAVIDRFRILLSAPKNHKQELMGILVTETF